MSGPQWQWSAAGLVIMFLEGDHPHECGRLCGSWRRPIANVSMGRPGALGGVWLLFDTFSAYLETGPVADPSSDRGVSNTRTVELLRPALLDQLF